MKKFLVLLCALWSSLFLNANEVSWESPQTISTMGLDASNPQIVMDSEGNVTVVWEEGGFVKASYQPLNGSFTSPATISTSGSSSPSLAIDTDGNVYAIWVDDGVVETASKSAGGSTWSGSTTLSSSGASYPKIGVNTSGDLVAVWVRAGFIEAKTKLILGLWSLASTLSGSNSDNPDLAVSEDGTVIAVWHTVSSGFSICQSSTQSAIGGVWTTPKNMISVVASYAFNYPKVAIDSVGNAIALAFRYQIVNDNYINVVLYGSELPKNAPAWKALPTALTPVPGIGNPKDFNTKLSLDANGNAMATWTFSFDNSNYIVMSSMKLFGKDWTETIQVTDLDIYAFGVDTTSSSIGALIGLYTFFDGDSSITLQSIESSISGITEFPSWSSPQEISTEPANVNPKLASVLNGTDIFAAAAWVSYDGSNTIIQVSVGSKIVLDPPTNLLVSQNSVDFGAYIDHYNVLSWSASSSPNIVAYAIFRNGIPFTQTPGNVLEVEEHNLNLAEPVTYGVAAIDDQFDQSPIVTISTP